MKASDLMNSTDEYKKVLVKHRHNCWGVKVYLIHKRSGVLNIVTEVFFKTKKKAGSVFIGTMAEEIIEKGLGG